jgi:hypothetical protein
MCCDEEPITMDEWFACDHKPEDRDSCPLCGVEDEVRENELIKRSGQPHYSDTCTCRSCNYVRNTN